jgi:hypothetical protein
MHFQLHHFVHGVSQKFQTFSEISQCLTVEKNGSRQGIGNDRTCAQLMLHDLQFPCRVAPQRQQVCTQTATYVAHFFQANLDGTRTMWKNEQQAGEITSS